MESKPELRGAIDRVRILGIPVDHVDMKRALDFIDSAIRNNELQQYILAINPEKVIRLQHDSLLISMFEKAALLIPDGIGIVLAIRLLYGLPATRVPGSELMWNTCREAARKGYKIFLYGSKEDVNKSAVEKLQTTFPGLQIVGRANGYLKDDEMPNLMKEINQSGADILFVALGSPKQEQWIQAYLPKLNVKICQGIGGTLDTIAGLVERAPVFFRKAGLEWLYRLIREPKRIRRQAALPIFVLKVIIEKFKLKSLR
jgi:N-acetylglucosaminyldiphosphoundecaprenol N-acetyl-beta-D-mannosaminyltransferase